jgi:hypothetical protein
MISWRVLDDIGSAVTITGCDEGRREVVAEERDIRRVRSVSHRELAAGSVTGICRRLHIRWIDVSKIYRVLTSHSCDGACEGMGVRRSDLDPRSFFQGLPIPPPTDREEPPRSDSGYQNSGWHVMQLLAPRFEQVSSLSKK